jgi:hypothetical protein
LSFLCHNVFFLLAISSYFFVFCSLLYQQKVQQHATQDQIAYFGQTPSQLLTVPHLKKMPLTDVLHLQVKISFIWLKINVLMFDMVLLLCVHVDLHIHTALFVLVYFYCSIISSVFMCYLLLYFFDLVSCIS